MEGCNGHGAIDLTLLDIILIAVMVISGLLAMVRGLVREIFAIASWVIAAGVTLYAYPLLLPYAKQHITNDTFAMAATVGGVFLLTLLIVSIITVRISDLVLDSRIGALDRTLGFLYGAARGVLVVSVGLLFFNWLVGDKSPTWIADAKSRPLLESIGTKLENMLPEDPEKSILKKLNPQAGEPGSAAQPTDGTEPADGEADAPAEPAPTGQPPKTTN